jgi:hypothetical protein
MMESLGTEGQQDLSKRKNTNNSRNAKNSMDAATEGMPTMMKKQQRGCQQQ